MIYIRFIPGSVFVGSSCIMCSNLPLEVGKEKRSKKNDWWDKAAGELGKVSGACGGLFVTAYWTTWAHPAYVRRCAAGAGSFHSKKATVEQDWQAQGGRGGACAKPTKRLQGPRETKGPAHGRHAPQLFQCNEATNGPSVCMQPIEASRAGHKIVAGARPK